VAECSPLSPRAGLRVGLTAARLLAATSGGGSWKAYPYIRIGRYASEQLLSRSGMTDLESMRIRVAVEIASDLATLIRSASRM